MDDVHSDSDDHMLNAKRESQVTFLHSEVLDRIPGIVHGFSTRFGLSATISASGLCPLPNPIIPVNRARFLGAVGAAGWPIMKLHQVHSGIVLDMDDTPRVAATLSKAMLP